MLQLVICHALVVPKLVLLVELLGVPKLIEAWVLSVDVRHLHIHDVRHELACPEREGEREGEIGRDRERGREREMLVTNSG